MFKSSPAPAALANCLRRAFSASSVIFSRIRPPLGFGFSALTPLLSGHMRPIDCAQRYTRQFANLWLGFPIFSQQYHLDTLSNDRVGLALQRLFQALYLVLVALDHPLPLANQSDGLTESHSGGYGEPLSGEGGC